MIIKLFLATTFAAPAPAVAADFSSKGEISATAIAGANQRLSARCRKPQFGVDELLSDAAHRSDLNTCSSDEASALVEYASCRTLQGAPGGCSSLEGLGRGFEGRAAQCRGFVAKDRFSLLILSGGDVLPACRSLSEFRGNRGPSVEKGCAAVIDALRSGNASEFCAALKRERLIGPQKSCEVLFDFGSGLPLACDRFKDADRRRNCSVDLFAGLRDSAWCASSPPCQAFIAKSPGACDSLRMRFSRALCARVAADIAAEQKRLAQEQKRLVQEQERRRLKEIQIKEVQAQALADAEARREAFEKRVKEETEKKAQAQAAVAAAVRAKAEAEAKKAAEAKAKIEKKDRPQFQKGAPMQSEPPEALEIIKAIEQGRPIPVKHKPKKVNPEDEVPVER